jgi:peptidoglycan/LPS O-acetylase OafA/YrhL
MTKHPVKNNFDLLRFLFASIVFLDHALGLSEATGAVLHLKFLSADIAVKSFFIISGFLIFMSYENSSNIHSYFIKRIRRIYPAYFTVVISCAVLGFFISTLSFQDYFSRDLMQSIGFNLIFLNFIHPSLPGVFEGNAISAVNGALWTLKIEVMFYILVPFIALFLNRLNRLFGLVLLYILSFAYSFLMLKLSETYGGGLFVELQRQLPGQLMYFVIGAAGYYYYEFFSAYAKPIFCLAIICFLMKSSLPWLAFEPVILGSLVLFLALSFPYLGNFSKYGDFSYGIYIIHFPLLQVFIAYHLFNDSPVLSLIISAFIVLALAIFLWFFVEKPFLKKNSHYVMT